ncbi:unnamed protein product [Didymodactylos carnosus]|uniref:Deacetylase sirtuin-type domain-containing protein n=1 Tax=Didymodactylos carnosus TaxID=1234261 RepID=A0A813PGX1_9BILA|nr:unnamed protein product [Didymodactylos carnosus]CAF3534055.1 unnamed protein product [Didymodactylos carnosus]
MVNELHGCSARVVCVDCSFNQMSRSDIQTMMKNENPTFTVKSDEVNPDADVYLSPEQLSDFKPPRCPECSGRVKPNVTFFGDNVDRKLVNFLKSQIDDSDSVLVAGSSLEVMSSYRFIIKAKENKLPIAIVNIGKTRGDLDATLKISTKCGSILPQIKV